MTKAEFDQLAASMRQLLTRVPTHSEDLSARRAKALREDLERVAADLRERLAALDPIGQPGSFFDPSDPRIFGVFAAIALVGQDRIPLSSVENVRFYGSGIYALYYNGEFGLYAPISKAEHPIYVGKAVPAHAYARTPQEQGDKLCSRLNQHRKNIARATSSLALEDFECRYLVVRSGWQEAAENALIALFHPLWNKETRILYGFGKHGDDPNTRANKRSPWDVLHPARKWAARGEQVDKRTVAEITTDVGAHFAKHPPVPDVQHVLRELVAQIKSVC